MSSVLGYLFILLPLAAVAWIVWRYRQKAVDKEAERQEREAALVEMVKQRAAAIVAAAAATPKTTATVAPVATAAAATSAIGAAPSARDTAVAPAPPAIAAAPSPAPPAVTTAGAAVVSGSERQHRFLSHSETLIYFLLRAGMPEHEIFPRASLASVLTNLPAAGAAPSSHTHELDFVVCDRRMRIVAVVQVEGRLPQPDRARVEGSLAAAGIRLVMLDPRALPRREELGTRILGTMG